MQHFDFTDRFLHQPDKIVHNREHLQTPSDHHKGPKWHEFVLSECEFEPLVFRNQQHPGHKQCVLGSQCPWGINIAQRTVPRCPMRQVSELDRGAGLHRPVHISYSGGGQFYSECLRGQLATNSLLPES